MCRGVAAALITPPKGRSRAQPTERPSVSHIEQMTAPRQLVKRFGLKSVFDRQHAGLGGARREGCGEMGAVEHWRVDGFLEIQSLMKMAQQEQERPLILLIAAGRTADEIGFAVALDQGWREGCARPSARDQTRGQALCEPEHLRSRSQRKTQLRDYGRTLEPSSAWRRRDHVAPAIDDVEMDCVAAMIRQFSERRLSASWSNRRRTRAREREHRLKSRRRYVREPWAQLHRRLFRDQPPALVIVRIAQERRQRYLGERRIAVERLAIGEGEFGAFGHDMHEIRAVGSERVKIESFQESQLL